MNSTNLLSNFQAIKIEAPADKIIHQIRELITSGQLKAGDRLPSERKLAERFNVGRGNVRIALQKLEFYGILKTLPQSGTVVAGIGMAALEGLISDVLKIENSDFTSLVETRVLLEKESARLAAERRTEKDIEDIKAALNAYEIKVKQGLPGVEEDLLFHLKIAEASKNAVLKSLMLIITPDIIKNFMQFDVCKDGRSSTSLEEHRVILKDIIDQNIANAPLSMETHLQDILAFSKVVKKSYSI